ncbi:hypothetical protein [Phaeospirillum tilakii]|uniref:Uncharacterized protein n=1 Tax=Phaeospirillum tilakii TaxID=741673 RepID=A0ABW5CDP2_9PROT
MNDLTTIPRPRTPVTARHQAALSNTTAAIADNQALIPADECRAIVAEMQAALLPARAEVAAEHARLIVAAYGTQKPDNPDAYARLVTLAATRCPADLLPQLVDEVTRRHPRFLPTKGEIEAVIADLRTKRVRALSVAEAHLKAHAKRQAERPKSTPEEREAMLARLRQRCPEVFGLASAARRMPGTVASAGGRASANDDGITDADIPRLREEMAAQIREAVDGR